MTGGNMIYRGDIQPEFWLCEFGLEWQKMFGSIDAPEYSPAGSMQRRADDSVQFPVSSVAWRVQ